MKARHPIGHLTLRQLEIFEALARHESVTRAAEALHLTQPAVSIQMKRLTDAVGRRLTEPAGRGVRLTQVGRDLFEVCKEMAALWSRFESRLDDVAALRRGRLSLSVVTTAKYFLPRALGRFVQQHPGIEVALDIQNREGVLARLRDRLDDLYVMSAPPSDLPVESEEFLDNPLVVIAPRGFDAPARPLRLSHLASERFLLREPGSGTRMAIDTHLARSRVALSHRMTVGSNEAIKQAVAGGLGLSILSRHALTAADLPEIRILEVEGFPIARVWQVVHWRDQHLSAAADAFRRYLLEFAAEMRGESAGGLGPEGGMARRGASKARAPRARRPSRRAKAAAPRGR